MGLKKLGKGCQKEGQGGRQGGCETGEEKGFPSYCPTMQAGTATAATVSLKSPSLIFLLLFLPHNGYCTGQSHTQERGTDLTVCDTYTGCTHTKYTIMHS